MPDNRLTAQLAKVRDRASHVNYAIVTESPRQFSIALNSQSDVPRLLAAVEQVLEVHGSSPAILDPDSDVRYCTCCGLVYPCQTVQIITSALLGEDEITEPVIDMGYLSLPAEVQTGIETAVTFPPGDSMNPTPDCGYQPRKPPAATELWWCARHEEFHHPTASEGHPDE